MAARNYLPGLVLLVKALCKFYDAHRVKLVAAVNGSTLTSDQKTSVIAFLSSIDAACAVVELLQVPEMP